MGVSSRIWTMSRLLGVALVAGASVVSLSAQETKTILAMPPVPLLPQQFGAWKITNSASGTAADIATAKMSGCQPDIRSTQSWSSNANAPNCPAILAENGLTRFVTADYTRSDGRTSDMFAEQFQDATGAYGAYTFYRSGITAPRERGSNFKSVSDSVIDGSGKSTLVWAGTAVLWVEGPLTREELATLVASLPKVGGTKGLPPLLPTYLPTQGLKRDTVKYALGPVGYQAIGGVLPPEIIGFDKAAEVVTAKYEGKGTLTMLLFPTPQIAGDHGRQIEAEMNRQGASAGTVKLRREGPLVLMTTGAWKPAEAQEMVENIHLRNEVTWNKPVPPEFHSEIRKTVSLLTSILLFCGLGALAAVVLALFFGGARAAIRVLQGKPAATEPEFLRIDLSGRPARIQPDGSGANPQG